MATETVVFKKKSRRNFRKKNFEDENEDEQGVEQSVEENSEEKNEEKPKKSSKSAPKTLLSFDHGEEENTEEVFKVKKSKESRRLSKQRNKLKKTKENEPEEKISGAATGQEDANDERLESLREELSNLGGDDDGGDDTENGGDKVIQSDGIIFKPLRANLSKDSFQIPDAAAIHAARKRREMARQLGSDFVPVDDTDRYGGRFETTDKSRLIREDENDHSDEDPDVPLGFGTKKSNHPDIQRRLEVEQALAKEVDDKENSEEEDDALRRFEEEQIRKGVSIPQAQQEEDTTYQMYVTQQYLYGTGNNEADPNYTQYNEHGVPMSGYPSYPPTSLSTVTMDMVWEKMNNRIVSLQEVNRGRRLEKEKMSSQMESCDASITSLERQMKDAESRYGFFQEMRGYVRDLIECLNEKVRQ